MTTGLQFALIGAVLFTLGIHGLIVRGHLLRRILALNVMGSGVFLVLAAPGGDGPAGPDPVPQAMVITGIVVAVSATALALALLLRLREATGRCRLPGDPPE